MPRTDEDFLKQGKLSWVPLRITVAIAMFLCNTVPPSMWQVRFIDQVWKYSIHVNLGLLCHQVTYMGLFCWGSNRMAKTNISIFNDFTTKVKPKDTFLHSWLNERQSEVMKKRRVAAEQFRPQPTNHWKTRQVYHLSTFFSTFPPFVPPFHLFFHLSKPVRIKLPWDSRGVHQF